jgi:hypothetical protein
VQCDAERRVALVVGQRLTAEQFLDAGEPVVEGLPAHAESTGGRRLRQPVPEIRVEGAEQLGAVRGVVVQEGAELLTEEIRQLRPVLQVGEQPVHPQVSCQHGAAARTEAPRDRGDVP